VWPAGGYTAFDGPFIPCADITPKFVRFSLILSKVSDDFQRLPCQK
jgi:hypothetical protein